MAEATPVILDKIQDMKVMDTLLRIFFSNFTITPGDDSFRKGSAVSYKLKEPWEGFVSANDFVRGAVEQNLLKLLEIILNEPSFGIPNIPKVAASAQSIIY